ncbi:MAG: glycosyltransferase family 2 protein [Alphaproteobacteria bacterium PRO2]|nr:glycosyltransferase family 2 protein [Alphaproteobacteria bacterium PRO2]
MKPDLPHKIAVVIPCYKVKNHIANVIAAIPDYVWRIYCVDDACPDGSGDLIRNTIRDPRLTLLAHDTNQGVGGAMVTGYKQALQDGAQIVVKIDGDGQMNPALIESFVRPILIGARDYTKGNRFYKVEDVRAMPGARLLGNGILSFMTKLSSGYWNLFDPNNGYTAIHAAILREMPLEKLSKRYFFESDFLFRLNTLRASVQDIPMSAIYGDEQSNLKISKIFFPFLAGHFRNLFKRIFYNYFLRDFNIASLELLLGITLLPFGIIFGIMQWHHSTVIGVEASPGTVMFSALPIILGVQFLLSFLQYDIESVPRASLHPRLQSQQL